MSLIQDLQGRELTGCRGCDAIRKGLYKGLDLWKPDKQAASTHDSFDASSLGAFIESPLKGRGSSAAIAVGDLSAFEFKHSGSTFTVRLWHHGDVKDDLASGVEAQIYDSSDSLILTLTALAGNLYSATPIVTTNTAECDAVFNEILSPLGWTRTIWTKTTGSPPDLGPAGDVSRIDLVTTATSEVYKSHTGIGAMFCKRTTPGIADQDTYINADAPCWSDIITGSSGTEAIFRWTKVDLGGGNWKFRPHAARENFVAPFSGTVTWWYNGTTDSLGIGNSMVLPGLSLDTCNGVSMPTNVFATRPTGSGTLPVGVEPLTINKVGGTTGETFDIAGGLLPIQNYTDPI